MIRYGLIVLLCIFSETLLPQHIKVVEKDSLVDNIANLPNDSLKFKMFADIYPNIRGKSWAEYFVSDIINLYNGDSAEKYELETYGIFVAYADLHKNNMMLNEIKPRLKELSYKYKKYRYYFRVSELIIKYDVAFDNIEYAIYQSDQMKDEAIKLHFQEGVNLSNLIKSNVYSSLNKHDKVIKIADDVINAENVPYRDLLIAVLYKSISYIKLKDYKNADLTLNFARKINNDELNKLKMNSKEHLSANILYIDILTAEVFLESKQFDKLYNILNLIDSNINNNTPVSHLFKLYYLKASYNSQIKNWEKALPYYDSIISQSSHYGANWKVLINFYLKKADALYNLGRKEDAVYLLDSIVTKSNVFLADMIEVQEDILQQNYKMNQVLIKSELIKRLSSIISILGFMIIIFIILILFIRISKIRNKRALTKDLVKDAYYKANVNNKLKEVFITNIRDRIMIPLSSVVEMSNKITGGENITQSEMEVYAKELKDNSNSLMHIINGVLELSRLEAGVANTNIVRCDIVSLLKGLNYINFSSNVNQCYLELDSHLFIKFVNLLLPFNGTKKYADIELNYVNNDNNHFITIIIIFSSSLELTKIDDSLSDVNNKIVDLLADKFGWSVNRERISDRNKIIIKL